jgi:2-methylcitrate dehydratase PrpD
MLRRGFLRMTATTAAGLALSPARVSAQGSGPGPEMRALSAYMHEAGTRALPTEAEDHAKHHVLDTLAAMISGSQLPPGRAAQRYVGAHGGRGATTIVGSLLTAAPGDAAFANGVMAHADETDDSHNASRSHPGLRWWRRRSPPRKH